MSMFSGSKNISIYGGEFHAHSSSSPTAGATSSAQVWREGLKTLRENIAPGAAHNSAERHDPPKCHPQTRKAVIKKIMDWIKDTEKLSRFLWLYGPAGAGKTAIGQTIAELCHKLKLLAASFFFSRSAAGRNDKSRFAATLAYQISISIPELREHIGNALDLDPVVLESSLENQIQTLIIDPLNEVCEDESAQARLQRRPRFIIIDGLDECTDPSAQKEILKVLSAAVEDLPYPLVFLIASRPEPNIRNAFLDFDPSVDTIALDDSYHPDADIKIFLESRFEDIRKKHPSGPQLPTAWPSKEEIQQLVTKASGQFIYASTVMNFVDSRNHQPQERLEIIFNLSQPRPSNEVDSEVLPFTELDALYHHILSSVYDIAKVLEVLSLLILTSSFDLPRSPSKIENLFFYKYGEVYMIMADMHSIIHVPSPEGEEGELRILHASLNDFLLDEQRSVEFFIDPGQANSNFTRHYIRHLKSLLLHPNKSLNASQQIARHSFLSTCSESAPTEELAKDLYELDIKEFLDLTCSLPYHEQQLLLLPQFHVWIKEQFDNRKPDLVELHTDGIARFFMCQLERYPEPIRYLLVGGIHPALGSLTYHYQTLGLWSFILVGIDSQAVNDLNVIDEKALFFGHGPSHRDPQFRTMVSTFLCGPRGYDVVGEEKLVHFVFRILQILLKRERNLEEGEDIDVAAMTFLQPLLSSCAASTELASFLRDTPIPFSGEYQETCYLIDEAITHYIEWCGLSRKLLVEEEGTSGVELNISTE